MVLYALHRFFVYKHGWYMSGLDPAGGSWNATAKASLMKDRAPAYILNLFEQRSKDRGIGLQEAFGGMFKVYTSLQLPTIGP